MAIHDPILLHTNELALLLDVSEAQLVAATTERVYLKMMPVFRWANWDEDGRVLLGFSVPAAHIAQMGHYPVEAGRYIGKPEHELKDLEVALQRLIYRAMQYKGLIQTEIKRRQAERLQKAQGSLF